MSWGWGLIVDGVLLHTIRSIFEPVMIPDQPLVDPPKERLDTAPFLAVPGIGGTVAGHYYHARRELHKGPFHGHLMRVPVGHTQQLTEGQPAIEVIYDDYFLVVVSVPPLPSFYKIYFRSIQLPNGSSRNRAGL